jgi:hypothetical protein
MPINSVRDIIANYANNPAIAQSKLITIAPQIPENILKNAVNAMAKHITTSEVALLLDTSLLSNGKNGFILADDALYSKEFLGQPMMIKYRDLDKVFIDDDKLVLNKKITFDVTSSDAEVYKVIRDILYDIIKHKKELPPVAPKADSAALPVDPKALQGFPYNTWILFLVLTIVPYFIVAIIAQSSYLVCVFLVLIIIFAAAAYGYHRFIDKIALFQLQTIPIDLDSELFLDRTAMYDILNEVTSSLNIKEQILIFIYKSKEVNSFMLPSQGGYHLYVTTTAVRKCTSTELKAMFYYALNFTVNDDYPTLLEIYCIFLAPILVFNLLFKAIYLPLALEFKFIPIESISSILTSAYKYLITDLDLLGRAMILFSFAYLFCPLGAIIATIRLRQLVRRADLLSAKSTGLVEYVYSLYNAYTVDSKTTPMQIEYTYLKFKFRFWGIFVAPSLKKRTNWLKY